MQANLSRNVKRGTVRGMHYQRAPFEEVKMVRCVAGAIYDAIIDLRRDSPTYLRWFGVELTREDGRMLYVPGGFAHGYQALTDDSEVLYLVAVYAPDHEAAIRWNDCVCDRVAARRRFRIAEGCRPPGLRSLNVLVTGATGFIGSHVVRQCLGQGWTVRASVRATSSHDAIADLAGRLELVPCDLWDATDAERARLREGVDLCIHAAWYAVPGQYLALTENLRCLHGSIALIEALALAKCPRVAMIGSCFEYGFEPGRLAETDPLEPASLYAATKAATGLIGEQLARARDRVRVGATLDQYGPFEDRRRLVPAVMTGLLRGERVDVTSGRQVRDFLHVTDVASADDDYTVYVTEPCGPSTTLTMP